MTPDALAELLAAPTAPLVRDALRRLPAKALDALAIETVEATEEAWGQVAIDRVMAFAAGQPDDGRPAVAAYFTTIEHVTAQGVHLEWNPFIAALSSSENVPDLRHTRTTVRVVPVGETTLAKEIADPELVLALDRLAVLDPPDHEDILRIHLPSRRITRVQL
jgi:hypothetical protein